MTIGKRFHSDELWINNEHRLNILSENPDVQCDVQAPKKRTFHLLFRALASFAAHMAPSCKLTFSVSGHIVLRGIIPNLV